MSNKSIIQVNVDDDQFKKFLDVYKKYDESTKAQPGVWDKVNLATDKANAKMKTLAGNVGTIAKHFDGIAKSILKIGAFAATGGGLGAFALDRMAGGVFNAQRSSRGLGVSIGQQSSFRVNMGRYVDPTATLSNVANARNDISQTSAFLQAGITPAQLSKDSNFQLSLDLIQNAKKIVDSTPPQMLQQVAQMRGLTALGFQLEDLRRLGAASTSEINGAISATNSDVGAFGLDAKTANQLSDLTIKFNTAGTAIETAFIRGLAPLGPEFASLSESTAKSIESLIGSNGFKEVIDDLSGGIKSLAAWMNSPDFSADLATFGSGIKTAGADIQAALVYLAGIPGLNPNAPNPDTNPNVSANPNITPSTADALKTHGGTLRRLLIGPENAALFPNGGLLTPGKPDFSVVDKQYGLPAGTTNALAMAENNGYLQYGLTSRAGAQGLMQLMPSVQKQYGVTDPFDPGQSAFAGGNDISDLYRRYGDMRKAVAAYNWGAGNLDADIKTNGKNWEAHVPKETQTEIARFFQYYQPKIEITVSNPAGANVHTSANAMSN